MYNITTSDVSRNDYNEAAALQQLIQAIKLAEQDFVKRCDNHEDLSGQFTVNIAGQSIAFILGGPQLEGLYAFINRIAYENFYDVDIDNGTVEG